MPQNQARHRPASGARTTGRRRQRQAGFTLLEGLIAFTTLSIAMMGILSTVVETNALRISTRESMVASQAAQSVLDEMTTADFAQLFALYNGDPADDPAGAGTAPGSGFAVPGLQAFQGDPDGLPGRIEFPGGPLALREDAVDPGLGMPRDLDSDGVVDGDDHSGDYTLLPVRIRVEWMSEGREQSMEFTTAFANI